MPRRRRCRPWSSLCLLLRCGTGGRGTPPPFDTKLVGKRIEICWPYKVDGKTVKIWASGTVKRVADGLTDTRSKTAQKVLPARCDPLGVGRRR